MPFPITATLDSYIGSRDAESIDIPVNARGRRARIAFHESPHIAAPLDLVYINYALKRDPPQGVRGEQMCGDLETSRANVGHLCAA